MYRKIIKIFNLLQHKFIFYLTFKKRYIFTSRSLLHKVIINYKFDYKESIHGINHWHRVYLNALEIAESYKIESPIFELFSIFHDSKRDNEYVDKNHGKRGSSFAKTFKLNNYINIDNETLNKLYFACENHNKPDLSHPYSNDILV